MAKSPAKKIDVKAFNALQKEIEAVYDGVIKLDSKLNGVLVKKFYDLARGVNLFVNAFKGLEELKDVDLSASVKSIGDFFEAVQKLDTQLQKTGGSTDASPIIKFSNSLYRLLLSFQGIGTVELKVDSLQNFELFFQKMDSILTGPITSLLKNIPNVEGTLAFFNSLKNIFLSVGDFVKAIAPVTGVIAGGTLEGIAVTFDLINQLVGGLLKTIGSSNIKGLKDIQTDYTNVFSSVLIDITNFLKNISPFLSTMQAFAFDPVTLKAMMSGLLDIFITFNGFIADLLASIGNSNIRGVAVLLQKDYTSVIPVILGDLKKFLVEIIPFLTLVQTYTSSGQDPKKPLLALVEIFQILNGFIGDLLQTLGNSNIKGFFVIQKDYLNVFPVVLNSLGEFLERVTPFFTEIIKLSSKKAAIATAQVFLSFIFTELNKFIATLLTSIGNSNIRGLIVIQKDYLSVVPVLLTNVGNFLSQLLPIFASFATSGLKTAGVKTATAFLDEIFLLLNALVSDLLATIGNSNIKGLLVIQKDYTDVIPLILRESGNFVATLLPLFTRIAESSLSAAQMQSTTRFLVAIFRLLNAFVGDLLTTIGQSNIKGFAIFQKSYLDVFPLILSSVSEFVVKIFSQFTKLLSTITATTAVSKTLILTQTLFVQLNGFIGALLQTIGQSNIKGFAIFQKNYLDVVPVVLNTLADFLSKFVPLIISLTAATAQVPGTQLKAVQLYFTDMLKTFSAFTEDILLAVGDSNIKGFFVFQKDYTNAFVSILGSVGDLITKLVPLIATLSAAKNTSEEFQTRAVFVKSILLMLTDFVEDLVKALPRRNIASIILVRRVFLEAIPLLQGMIVSVTDLLKVVSKNVITKASAEAFQTVLASLMTMLREIYTFTVNASSVDVGKFRSILPTLLSPIETFAKVLTAFAAAGSSEIKTEALVKIFDAFLEVLIIIQNSVSKMAAQLNSDGYLKTLVATKLFLMQTIGIIGSLQSIFTTASLKQNTSASYKAISEVFANIPALLESVQDVVTKILSSSAFAEGNGPFKLLGIAVKYRVIFGAVRSLLDVFNTYLVNIGALKGISPNVIASLVSVFTSARDIVTAVLAFELPSGFWANVKALYQYGFVLPTILNSVKSLTNFFSIIDAARTVDPKAIAGIGEMFKAVRVLTSTLLDSGTWTDLAAKAPTWAQGVSTVIGSIRTISGSLVGLLEAARGVAPESIRGLGDIFKGLGELFPGLAATITNIAGIVGGNIITTIVRLPLQLFALRKVFDNVLAFVRAIIDQTTGFSTERIGAIGTFSRGIGELFGGLGKVFNSLAKSEFATINPIKIAKNLVSMELVLYPLRRTLDIVTKSAAGFDANTLNALGQFTRFIGEAMTALGKVFAEVKYHATGIGEVIKSVFLFQRVTSPLIQLVKIVASIPKSGSLTGAGEYIESISKFIKEFADLLKDDVFVIDEAKIKGVAPFFKAITKVFEQTFKIDEKSLKGLKQLSGAAKQLEGLKSVATTLESFSKINVSGGGGKLDKALFSSLGDGVVELAQGLDKLTDGQLKNLIAVAEALSKLPVDALQKALKLDDEPKKDMGDIRDISEDVAQGFQKANSRAAAFKAVMSGIGAVISLLDPRRPIELLLNGLSQASQAVTNLKTKFFEALEAIRQLGENVKGFGTNLITNFGIGNLISSDIFKATVEFDKLGSSLEVFGGLTKEQRKEAEDFANVLGKDYPLSANEALKSTLDLVKAGQDLASAKSILPAAADLASLSDSGSIENATAFIIQATSSFREFNETTAASYENAATAVNIISAVADSTTASVEGLSAGLANVGPVARTLGLDLEETTAILGLFNDAGIKDAEAGTQLKSLLTNLSTKEAQKELKRLNVDLTDQAGNFRSIIDIAADLNEVYTRTGTIQTKVTKGLTAEEQKRLDLAKKALAASTNNQFLLENDLNSTALGKNADKKLGEAQEIAANAQAIILEITGSERETQTIVQNIQKTQLEIATSQKKLGGSYGQSGLSILVSKNEEEMRAYLEQVRQVAPASERARAALDNIAGDLVQLQGSVETLTTKALAPLLEKFFRPFVQIGRAFVDTLLSIDEGVLEFIATALALGSALLTVVGSVAVFVGGLIQLGGAASYLVSFFALGTKVLTIGFLGAITGLAAGIATLAAGFLIITPILSALTAGFDTLYRIFAKDLGGAATQAQHFASRVVGAMSQIGTALGEVLGFVVELVSGGQLGSLEDVGERIAGFFNSLSLQVTKFQTSGAGKVLMDIGQIFGAFTKALTFDAGAKKAADDAVAAIDNVNMGFKGKSAREATKARKEFLNTYSTFIVGMTRNNALLKSILGDQTLSVEQVQAYLDKAVYYVELIRDGIGNVFNGIGDAFASAQAVLKAGGGIGDAVGVFVSELGKNLDNSIGGLAATVLRAIGDLFNIKTGALADIFDTKGFGAGLANLIQKALAGAKKLLLANKDGVKGFLTSIFENIFLGTLNLGKFIANFLGQGELANFIGGIVDSLKQVFGGFVDTIFNIIGGQDIMTALKNAFGPGIQPFIDLVGSLGRAVDNIVGFITTIIGAIFTAPPGVDTGEPFLLKLFNGVVNGLTGVIDFLNNNILNFLKTGDIGGMITNLVNSVSASIQSLDLPTKFATAAGDIVNGLVSALKSAFLTVANLLGFDGNLFLTQISEAMASSIAGLGDGATVFEATTTAIQALLVTALDSIFTGLGTLLNIDTSGTITKINESIGGLISAVNGLFSEETFSNIKNIIDDFVIIINKLFGTFSSPEAEGAKTKIDPIRIALQFLIDTLAGITTTVLDTLTEYVNGITTLVAAFASLDPAQMFVATLALTSFGAALALYFGVGTVIGTGLTAAAAGLTALGASAYAAIAPFATIAIPLIVFSQLIRALFQNLGELEKGFNDFKNLDFAAVLGNFSTIGLDVFTDLALNILGIFGLDKLFPPREELHRYATVIEFYFTQAFSTIGTIVRETLIQPLNDFVTVTIPLIVSELQKARLRVDALLGDGNAQGLIKIFDNIDLTAGGGLSFDRSNIDGFIGDVFQGGEAARQRLIAISARDNVAIFNKALADYSAAPDADAQKRIIDNIVKFFNVAGLTDNALTLAAQQGEDGFIQAYFNAAAAQGIDTTEAQKRLADDVNKLFNLEVSGETKQLAVDRLNGAISALVAAGLDPTFLEGERDKLVEKANALLDFVEGVPGDAPPIDVPVTVTPDVTVTPPLPEDDIYNPASPNYIGKAILRDQAGVALPLDLNVQPKYKFLTGDEDSGVVPALAAATQAAVDGIPAATPLVNFDASSLTDPTAVQEFNTLIGTLITNIATLGTDLSGVATNVEPVKVALTEITTAVTLFRDVTTPLFTEVGLAASTIGTALRDIQTSMLNLFVTATVGFPLLALSVTGSVAVITYQFALMRSASDSNLQSVVSKVKELANAFKEAAAGAKALGSQGAFGAAGGGGGSVGPGRADGGFVRAGLMYPFLEKKEPELLQMRNKTYLAVPSAGKVTPLKNMSAGAKTGLYNTPQANGRAMLAGAGAGGPLSISQGDINISITGVDPRNVRQITDAVGRRVTQEQSRGVTRLSDKLRSNHR